MNIDETKIKCSFTQETSQLYEIDEDVEITLKGSIVKHLIGSNQDGSVNVTAVFKPVTVEIHEKKSSSK